MKNILTWQNILLSPLFLFFAALIIIFAIVAAIPTNIYLLFNYGIPRYRWTKKCGAGKKYIVLENDTLLLKIGEKCHFSIPIDCIADVRYDYFFRTNYLSIRVEEKCIDVSQKQYFFKRYYRCQNVVSIIDKFEYHNIDINRIDRQRMTTGKTSILITIQPYWEKT